MYYIRIRLIIKLLQILALPDQDLMKPSGNYKVGIKSREKVLAEENCKLINVYPAAIVRLGIVWKINNVNEDNEFCSNCTQHV